MQAKIEGDGVVQSVITTVFSGGISTFFQLFKIFISMISIILKINFALAKLNLDKIVHLHKNNFIWITLSKNSIDL